MYVKGKIDEDLIIICLYVDDSLVIGSHLSSIEDFKKKMHSEFEMTDLGHLHYFLGMEFDKTAAGLVMHQKKYVRDMLRRFNMTSCNPVSVPVEFNMKLRRDETSEAVDATLYKQIVGSLSFLCNTRPDICYGVGLISRFMCDPRKIHMATTKKILRYLAGTSDFGILFPVKNGKSKLELLGYADSDYSGDLDERKSTSGYLFLLNGAPISWCSKKQLVIALSSCEEEYISGSFAACQATWLGELLKEMLVEVHTPLKLMIDNVSAISLARNPLSHGRNKHIEVRFHFLREQINKGVLELVYCSTERQLADAFTKALRVE